MLTADILRPDALTTRDLRTWEAMRDSAPVLRNPLLGPRWAQAVGAARDDAFVAVLKRNGVTAGFLAHHRRPDGYARPIGAPFCDLHALIAEPGSSLTLQQAVSAAGLRAFRCSGLLSEENAATGTLNSGGQTAYVIQAEDGQDLLETVRQKNAKRFKNWRRLGHKLDREMGEVALVAHEPSLEAYEALLGWKRAQLRRSGLHDVYRPAWVQRLLRGLFDAPSPAFGGLQVTLWAGGRPVAGEFGVREGDSYHPWIAAYDPELAAYSPGMTLQLRLIEAMPSLGLTRYDLGASSDAFKAPLATGTFGLRSGVVGGGRSSAGASPLSGLLGRSRLATRIGQRLEQIAAVETTTRGRVTGVIDAVRDSRKRLAAPDTHHAEA